MALRVASKINRQLIKNVCRTLSTKRDAPETSLEAAGASEGAEPSPRAAYHVCQPRAAAVQRAPSSTASQPGPRGGPVVQNETDAARNAMAMQHLQPALLPEFFKPPLEINSGIYSDTSTEADRQARSAGRASRFEESSTRLSLTLPLKLPKLANPFPEPVKEMMSHTVSDREKAELMLAEQKMAARTALPPLPPSASQQHMQHQQQQHHLHQQQPGPASTHGSRERRDRQQQQNQQQQQQQLQQQQQMSNSQRRFYSTGHGKRGRRSRKLKMDEECGSEDRPVDVAKRCRHLFRLACCAPVHAAGCERPMATTCCKKTLAPYPAYSEYCVTKPYQKPSECRQCPWRRYNHPAFRQNKKTMHTETAGLTATSKQLLKPSGTVAKRFVRQPFVYRERATTATAPVACRAKKPPCKRPPGQCEDTRPRDAVEKKRLKEEGPCPAAPDAKHQQQSTTSKDHKQPPPPQKQPKQPKQKKSAAAVRAGLDDQIGLWLHRVGRKTTPLVEAAEAQKVLVAHIKEASRLRSDPLAMLLEDANNPTTGDCGGGGGGCKKFPFRSSTFPLIKQRKPKARQYKPGECPKEPSQKPIRDCPSGPKDRCGSNRSCAPTPAPDRARATGALGAALAGLSLRRAVAPTMTCSRLGYRAAGKSTAAAGGGGSGAPDGDGEKKDEKERCEKMKFPECPEADGSKKERTEEEDVCGDELHPRTAYCPKNVGVELGIKRPKFVPKTEEEIDQAREEKNKKKTSSRTTTAETVAVLFASAPGCGRDPALGARFASLGTF